MTLGPLEFVQIEFKGNKFKGEIVPALREVVEKGIIRVVDLVFIRKDTEGAVTALELDDLDQADSALFHQIAGDVAGLLSEQDVTRVAGTLENNSSAVLMLFEHTWAARIREAVMGAEGRMVRTYRIPNEAVQAALAARA